MEIYMQSMAPSNSRIVGDKYTTGDPTKGTPTSIVPPEYVDNIAKEILNVITNAGMKHKNENQLYTAICTIIQKDSYVNYLYNNILDLCGFVGLTIDNKDTTQIKKVLVKLLSTASCMATTKQAGTVIIGDTIDIDKGIINVKPSITELSTISKTGTWSIQNINPNKAVFIKHSAFSIEGHGIIKEVTNIKNISAIEYVFSSNTNNHLLIPSGTSMSLEVLALVDSSLTAYQF